MMADATLTPIELTRANSGEILSKLPTTDRILLEFALSLEHGRLTVTLSNDQVFVITGKEPGPNADVRLINEAAFLRKLLWSSDVGVAEAYMDGDWTSDDVTSFLELFVVNRTAANDWLNGHPVARLWMRFRHWMNRNNRRGARRNIAAHYDLGNRFYASWLDPSMTYSSALFATGANDLHSAQNAKYRSLAEAADIKADHDVLEIGCGWGGFAEFAGREIGCRVKALTISREQYDFARQRVFNAGLADKIDIVLQDYRDEKGLFDRIVSIEMFEAVGEKYWPVFFDKVSTCLKAGGRAGLQIITIQDKFFDAYRKTPDFIQRYVFPGGMLPSPDALNSVTGGSGLDLSTERIFGHDYARTLKLWRERFHNAWPGIQAGGYDERFHRLWELYLHYCEAGFRAGNIDVRQLVATKL